MTASSSKPRVFGVDYQFLSCGSVFTDGLVHAAESLGVDYQHADWADPRLPDKVRACGPDLVFVVHGRRFCHRWTQRFTSMTTAVWCLDEPYEVDDTARWSSGFTHVFVSDPSTRHRHQRATYLPVCYDPVVHYPTDVPKHGVGFIGGGNSTREQYLTALANAGLLTYVVGGPWASPALRGLCKSLNIPAGQTAALYRQTAIVVNIFRERHHYNREGLPATSMNPRIYEALACGALVVSEWRPEIESVFPELPTFRSVAECLALVADFAAHPDAAQSVQQQCAARLTGQTYADRLATVLRTTAKAVAA